MNESAFASQVLEAEDALEANEMYQRNGWTDGLPIVAPTVDRVARFLDCMGMPADHAMGVEPFHRRHVTAEKVAIAGVMAGCLPEYMPVVAAAVRAMCAPQFSLHEGTVQVDDSARMLIVNGPIRHRIGMGATHDGFAAVSRATATIGRSIHLIALNVFGARPHSTLAHAGMWVVCVPEHEEDSPWPALAQERGMPRGGSAVTLVDVGCPQQVVNDSTHDPRGLLETYAAAVTGRMLTSAVGEGNHVMLVSGPHRDALRAAGWTRQDIREFVFERCHVLGKNWRDRGKGPNRGKDCGHEASLALGSPNDLLVVAAKGTAAGGAVAAPAYGRKSAAVTAPVTLPHR